MKNKENEQILKKIELLNDGLIEDFNYDYRRRTIEISVTNLEWTKEKKIKVRFNHVSYLNIQSCDFFGPVQHIYFVEVLDAESKIEELYNHFCKENHIVNQEKLNEESGKIEVLVTLKSGNEIDVICEKIEYNDRE